MYDERGEAIYVGKAKDLKKRLASYFRERVDRGKTQVLVSKIASIDVTVTHTEAEALVLEQNYIKRYQPRYNILLRDDKSYPFIVLSAHQYPRISLYRGPRKGKHQYFGPYPNGGAARDSMQLLQKLFKLRPCPDSVFSHRSRPCLSYQLGRCSAPCVDKITEQEYQQQLEMARVFLKGRSQELIGLLVEKMEQASQALQFEQAAQYRDQIQMLRQLQQQQSVEGYGEEALDVIGVASSQGLACVHLLFIREQKVLGSRSYFPKIPADTDHGELLRAFILQFYLEQGDKRQLPRRVLLSESADEMTLLAESLSAQAGHPVRLQLARGPHKSSLTKLAVTNASSALATRLSSRATLNERYRQLEQLLQLKLPVSRMECFDISHTMGEKTVGSCVVFDRNGPQNSQYRRFNIEGITPGDDYAAMRQVLQRRYLKGTKDQCLPDIIWIDGGKGQLSSAEEVLSPWLDSLAEPRPLLIGIAKGEGRKPGLETLILGGSYQKINLDSDHPALHLIQQIRDEAHRFAIGGHRQRRGKARTSSALQQIPGVGAKRRQALLKYLGGIQEVMAASVEDLTKVPGISAAMAEKIFHALHH